MCTKLNITSIVKDHLNTLYNNRTQKISITDIIELYFLPFLLSLILVLIINFGLTSDITSILITSFSIFTALLFNLLVLLFDIVNKNKTIPADATDEEKKGLSNKLRLLKEVYSNISYCILVSIIVLVLLIISLVSTNEIFIKTMGILVYFGCLNFILILIVILKRIHILFSNEF